MSKLSLMILATLGMLSGAEVDCSAHPASTTNQFPAGMQGVWTGPFAWRELSGTVTLSVFNLSYSMYARVQQGTVLITLTMPECVQTMTAADANSSYFLNASVLYSGTGSVPYRTADECISFQLVNVGGVSKLMSGQGSELVTSSPSGNTYRGLCVESIPSETTASIVVATYTKQTNAAQGTFVHLVSSSAQFPHFRSLPLVRHASGCKH